MMFILIYWESSVEGKSMKVCFEKILIFEKLRLFP